jgi:hypothetical protein
MAGAYSFGSKPTKFLQLLSNKFVIMVKGGIAKNSSIPFPSKIEMGA